jgi:hypothetical protein
MSLAIYDFTRERHNSSRKCGDRGLERKSKGERRRPDRMDVVFYAVRKTGAEGMLEEAVTDVVSSSRLKIFRALKDLETRLRRPRAKWGREIFVLAISNQGDLEKVMAMKDFLIDVPLILILSDQDEATVSKAHSLYPRFLSYAHVAPEQVKMVLQRMLLQINSNNKEWDAKHMKAGRRREAAAPY